MAEYKEGSVDALYDTLSKAESKSALKRFLTKEIFEKLKDVKTKQGCDFQSVIQSGVDNLDSGMGVYASDADAYTVYGDLLNPIIAEYHKLDTLDGFAHPKQNFSFDDAFPGDLDPKGDFVISTRVRVARNIEGYPLRGGMNQAQTLELESKVKDILEAFEDQDLKGKYYPLKGMDEATRQQLVDDHFLFKKGDRFLESAGINQFWPDGRGIFFNTAKTFLVWINEEDQLRIISMEQGANIKSVFSRLEKAVAAINEKLQFAYSEQLGYLTACPTNIGCGERASVHIKVPLTSRDKAVFDAIATKNNLQIRGIHGEHSESAGGVYDVSNKRRLGITEWDGVKDLINGVKELIESETKLRAAEDANMQTEVVLQEMLAKNEYPEEALKACSSLMSKNLNKELFEKLKGLKTKATGFTLAKAINTGVKNTQSLMGIHAGDIESYSLFEEIFGAVIEQYHNTKTYHEGIKSSFSADGDDSKKELELGDIPNISRIKSTRIRVARNIDGFGLAPCMTDVEVKLEIERLMKVVFEKYVAADEELKGTYYPLYGMDPAFRQKLIDDHFLFSGNDDPMQTDSGYHLWFPKGRGIYLAANKKFIVWLNEGDHLRLISMEQGNNVNSVFNRLRKAVIIIEDAIKKVSSSPTSPSRPSNGFLFHKSYGNVTCCPTNLGTGLRASVHINMPSLAKNGLDALNDIGIKYKMQIRGLYGEHSEIEEDAVIDISNKFRMGYSEFTLVQFMCDGVNALNAMEEDLLDKNTDLFKEGDKCTVSGLKEKAQFNGKTVILAGPWLTDTMRWPVVVEDAEGTKLAVKGSRLSRVPALDGIDKLWERLCAGKTDSRLKKFLSKEVFEKLKDVKTKLGCDLASCIRSGVDNLDSGNGVYASDADAYSVFGALFDNIIVDYHKLGDKGLDGFQHPKQDFGFKDGFEEDLDKDGKFVISTRVRVARNIEGYPLRGGMDLKQTVGLEKQVKEILEGFEDEDLKGKYYPLKGMDEATRQQLVDDHFLFKKGDRFLESAGINQFWPDGRGIFFNTAKTFLVWINEEDQLRIISMEQGANIKSVFSRLEKAVAAINEKLQFAYSEQLGYLTACPTNIGCGERASVHIKVPLTSKDKTVFDAIATKNNLQIRGIHGEHSESAGGIYDVSNKRRLGITEWEGVQDLINGVKELIASETKLQALQAEQ